MINHATGARAKLGAKPQHADGSASSIFLMTEQYMHALDGLSVWTFADKNVSPWLALFQLIM